MRQRLLPGTILGALAILTLALWLTVFARSSSSPDGSSAAGTGDGPADVVTATPGQDAPAASPSRSPRPSPSTSATRSPSTSPSASDSASPSPSRTPSPTPTPSPEDSTPSADPEPRVRTAATRLTAAPYETVPLRGAAEGVAPGTQLRVQYLRGDRWRPFPLPAATGPGGRYTAYVELGAPGTYELRVREPKSGATSPTVTLQVG